VQLFLEPANAIRIYRGRGDGCGLGFLNGPETEPCDELNETLLGGVICALEVPDSVRLPVDLQARLGLSDST
jgi:hypothetical protein